METQDGKHGWLRWLRRWAMVLVATFLIHTVNYGLPGSTHVGSSPVVSPLQGGPAPVVDGRDVVSGQVMLDQ